MRALLIACALLLAAPAAADALPLYVNAHQGGHAAVPKPGRFEAIVGYADQCVAGIPCWAYSKGTRTPISTYPERWYIHQDGVRVHDAEWPRLFVMNPSRAGWRQTVAAACARHCFLDGLGTSAITRTNPRLTGWSVKEWITAVSGEIHYIRSTGKAVLPNSIGNDSRGHPLVVAAGGRGSTEGYTARNARYVLHEGRIWVAEHGKCDAKWNAYRRYTDGNDHFSCYMPPLLPWNTSWLTR